MKKGIIKAAVLITVFIVGIVVFSALTNQTNEDLTREMSEATLPLVSLYSEETQINELHGYIDEMNAIYMREDITPVPKDRLLPISIQTYGTKIDGISYEIRSMDTERLIADAEASDILEEKEKITANIKIQNLLEVGKEYLLILKLESASDTIYYYSRIITQEQSHLNDCLEFAMDFHNKTFDKGKAASLATYLEPNSTADNTTLNEVSIHSTLNQVSWADFVCQPLSTPIPSVKEINDSYNVIELKYVVTATEESGVVEYYNVAEVFRIRYTSDRMYLLSYNRSMNQIFRAESSSFYDNYIQLGIRNQNVEYQSNEKGDIVSFVQEGELWSYNETSNQLSQVFTFNGNEGINDRENYDEHDIKIISIDETGSVNFVVYGYMNAGSHEGKVGICVYHYDSVANTVEEELFIPTRESYQVMKEDLGQMMYENIQGIFFIMLDGTVYRIDLATMDVGEMITGLEEGDYAISDSHKHFAWIEREDALGVSTLNLMDLDTEQKTQITENQDEYLRPLGFMEEDFAYGIAKVADVTMDLAGTATFPMYKLKIVDSADQKTLKEYQKDGFYVSDISIEDYIMYLNRLQYNGMAYVESTQDTIMNKEGDSKQTVDIHTTATEIKETQVQISLAEEVQSKAPKILTPKEVVFTDNREVTFESENDKKSYYVYARGDVIMVTDSLKDAIGAANSEMGVVIGNRQEYIWKRARKTTKAAIGVSVGNQDTNSTSIAKCISAMLEKEGLSVDVSNFIDQGKTPKEILEDTMQEANILDLTGCNLEEVLYYVNLGNPVFAMKSNTEAVLITGYDTLNVEIFDTGSGSGSRVGLQDATEMFANAGNIFFGYEMQE